MDDDDDEHRYSHLTLETIPTLPPHIHTHLFSGKIIRNSKGRGRGVRLGLKKSKCLQKQYLNKQDADTGIST